MPPKTPKLPKTPKTSKPQTAATASAPGGGEEELAQRLEVTAAQLNVSREKLERLAFAQAALDVERAQLATQLAAERSNFEDITARLRAQLAEQTARAEALQASLADSRSALAAAQNTAAEAAASAERRRQEEVGEKQAELASQAERVRQADEYLAERDSLKVQVAAAQAALEDQKGKHHQHIMNVERRHAADRELWRKETQEAVRVAREEMAALADQRLDATTKQTICDNEAMAGELQYQGRHVQGLLSRNSALQKEVAGLRRALEISRSNEEELGRKARACEKAVESMMAQLEVMQEERETEAEALASLATQLAESQGEVAAMGQRLEDQTNHLAELEDRLEKKRQEARELRATHNEAAGFLLQCFIEARQGLLAEQGHATLAAAASPTASQPDLQQQQQQYSNSFAAPQESSLAGGLSAVAASSPALGQQGGAPPQVPLQLGQLSTHQRDALLQHMLDKLGAEWQEKEGLVLPATSSSLSSSMLSASVCYSPGRRAQQPAVCSPRGSPAAVGCGAEAAAAADGGSPASEELMRVLRSDVRPWGAAGGKGGAAAGPAVTHQLTAAGGAGITLRTAAGSR